jgi:hypothetical protein
MTSSSLSLIEFILKKDPHFNSSKVIYDVFLNKRLFIKVGYENSVFLKFLAGPRYSHFAQNPAEPCEKN